MEAPTVSRIAIAYYANDKNYFLKLSVDDRSSISEDVVCNPRKSSSGGHEKLPLLMLIKVWIPFKVSLGSQHNTVRCVLSERRTVRGKLSLTKVQLGQVRFPKTSLEDLVLTALRSFQSLVHSHRKLTIFPFSMYKRRRSVKTGAAGLHCSLVESHFLSTPDQRSPPSSWCCPCTSDLVLCGAASPCSM